MSDVGKVCLSPHHLLGLAFIQVSCMEALDITFHKVRSAITEQTNERIPYPKYLPNAFADRAILSIISHLEIHEYRCVESKHRGSLTYVGHD